MKTWTPDSSITISEFLTQNLNESILIISSPFIDFYCAEENAEDPSALAQYCVRAMDKAYNESPTIHRWHKNSANSTIGSKHTFPSNWFIFFE